MSEIDDLRAEVRQLRNELSEVRTQAVVAYAAAGLMARILAWMNDGIRKQLESGFDQVADRFMKDGLPKISTALFEFSALHVRKRPSGEDG